MIKSFEEKCRLLNYELYLLHTISKSIKESFDESTIINTTLTGLTANGALGLSRASVFYYNRAQSVIYGKGGIGPFDKQEAFKIWEDLSRNIISLEQYLEYAPQNELQTQRFPQTVKNIVINFDALSSDNFFRRAIQEKQIFHVKETADKKHNLPKEIVKAIFIPSEIMILPLFSSKDVIGIIMADNAFHYNPIDESTVLLISLLSIQTGIALENAYNHTRIKQQFEELKELQTAKENLQEELIKQEKLSTVGKMASYFIHEIKNPLATIGGFAKRITEGDNVETNKRDAGIIFKEIQKLEQILNKLAGFTLLSPAKIEKVNILEVVNELINFFEMELSRKHITVKLDIPETLNIKAERVQIFEVLFNIIANACESMTKGVLKIYASVEYPNIKISVADTGKGIPEENIPRITEPFFSTKSEGFGLGLFIVSNVIENYGGKIEFSSTEEEGTEVDIYLPM